MKRNYELNELNEFQRLNLAAKAANDNESTIRIHAQRSCKIKFVQNLLYSRNS